MGGCFPLTGLNWTLPLHLPLAHVVPNPKLPGSIWMLILHRRPGSQPSFSAASPSAPSYPDDETPARLLPFNSQRLIHFLWTTINYVWRMTDQLDSLSPGWSGVFLILDVLKMILLTLSTLSAFSWHNSIISAFAWKAGKGSVSDLDVRLKKLHGFHLDWRRREKQGDPAYLQNAAYIVSECKGWQGTLKQGHDQTRSKVLQSSVLLPNIDRLSGELTSRTWRWWLSPIVCFSPATAIQIYICLWTWRFHSCLVTVDLRESL